MEDAKAQIGATPPAGPISGEPATPSVPAPVPNQTAVESQPTASPSQPTASDQKSPVRTIPYQRFAEVNKQRRELQRQLAGLKGRSQLEGIDPEETERVLQHPLVQRLLINQAKTEVTDFAKEYLEEYLEFPPIVKKAILKNVRGFINEETTDPETAKEDVRQYIDEVWEETQKEKTSQIPAGTQPTVPIINPTNAGGLPQNSAVRPKDIQEILEKPVTEWTDEDTLKVEQYSKTTMKK